MSDTWDDIVKDWEKVPVEAYQFLFSQARDRYEEVMSESESITNKAIKLTTISIAAISGFVSYKFTENPNPGFVVLLSFLFVGDLICLGVLLFPKRIIQRGSPPNETFIDYLDNSELEEQEKTKLVYYHELKRYQKNMAIMEKRNSDRHWFYGIALCLTIVTTVITAGVIISTIYHP
jgi:hypothetical protein